MTKRYDQTQFQGALMPIVRGQSANDVEPTGDSFLRFRGEILEHLHFAGKAADVPA